MNQILFYGGLVLAIIFFLLTVFLFFFQRIPIVIKYFNNIKSKKVFKNSRGNYKVMPNKSIQKSIEVGGKDEIEQKTELLDIAQNYATALLDADSTVLLPEIDE